MNNPMFDDEVWKLKQELARLHEANAEIQKESDEEFAQLVASIDKDLEKASKLYDPSIYHEEFVRKHSMTIDLAAEKFGKKLEDIRNSILKVISDIEALENKETEFKHAMARNN